MPSLPTTFQATAFPLDSLPFSVAAPGISQAAVALKVNANDATTGSLNIVGIPALQAGSIVGISIVLTANKTAGVMTFTPTINATAITTPAALVAVAVANATQKTVKTTDAQQTGARFAQGDLLGVKFTTDAAYAPTTNDVYVLLYVVYDMVEF